MRILLSGSSNEYEGEAPAETGHGAFVCQRNGNAYAGEYDGTRMHGVGVLRWGEGHAYRGQWRQGRQDGYGVFYHANGDVHAGMFQEGRKEGYGVARSPNGPMYLGQFKRGQKEGSGVSLLVSGQRIFGLWKGDKEMSSVPYDAANSRHTTVLRRANEAEARRPFNVRA